MQLTFVCGPDKTFSDKSKGPTGINWAQRFALYKCTVLKLPSNHRARLLAWYDIRIFGKASISNPVALSTLEQGLEDVNDLIERLGSADLEVPADLPTVSLTPQVALPPPCDNADAIEAQPTFSAATAMEGDVEGNGTALTRKTTRARKAKRGTATGRH
jgi:hypothetical protein